jgi:hypothetical protein
MPRYRLRTLLIVLALGPPALAGVWWIATQEAAGVVVLVSVLPASVLYAVVCVAIGITAAVLRDRS